MFEIAVNLPAVFGDRSLFEGIAAASDLEVDGIEFFDWESHEIEDIVEACDEAGLSLAATLSAGAGSNIEKSTESAMTNPDDTEQAIADIRRSIDVCASVNCPNLIVTVGPNQNGLDRSVQRELVIKILSDVASDAEDAGVTLVVEPLNVRIDHPGYFLSSSSEAFDIIASVDSSNVKVLFDIYHQQVTEGDITRRLTENLEHVGHVHIAGNPGRNEPGTGELDYENIVAALANAGYEGYIGCEFMPQGSPTDAVRYVNTIVDRIDT